MNLKEQIAAVIKGDVADDDKTLAEYSHDASIFELRPRIVVFPKDAEDIEALVRFVNGHPDLKLSLTPRSAGTDMTGGAIGTSIIVECDRYLNHLKEVGDGYAVTEPGVYYRDFEKQTLAKDWLLPSYPASREICTVGGMAANNSGGEKSLRYGKTENYIRRLRVVLSDGNAYLLEPLAKDALDRKMAQQDFEGGFYREMFRLIDGNRDLLKAAKPDVSKNSAGYYLWNVWDGKTFDLTKLFTGSQGTLGIITEITYGLVRPAKHSKLLVIFLKDLKPLADVINRVLKVGPESFESYDDYTLKFAIKYFRDILKHMKGQNLLSLAWQFLPEAWMVLTGGLPKQVMLAEFTGDTEEEVDRKCRQAQEALADLHLRTRITKTEREAQKYWVIRRESFNLLRHHFKKLRTAPFIDDLCVLPSKLPEFLPKLYAILDQYDLVLTVVGHMGDGNFHIIPLMDLADPKTPTIIRELSQKVYDLVFSYGGTMTGEHNDGLVRSPFLKKMYGENIYELFEDTKRIFDPHAIFNPGKKVGADFDEAMRHLNKH